MLVCNFSHVIDACVWTHLVLYIYKYSAKAYLHFVISEMRFQARILNRFKGKAGVGGGSVQKKEGGWGIEWKVYSKFDEKFNVRVI